MFTAMLMPPSTFAIRLIQSLILAAVLSTAAIQAQTYRVIYAFTGGPDGANPVGLAMDSAGNLYGAAGAGGENFIEACRFGQTDGCGTVFKLMPTGGGWQFNILHQFSGDPDGSIPASAPTLGPDGNLYGTTLWGGMGKCVPARGCGTVYEIGLSDCRSGPCTPSENILYRFTGNSDGAKPDGDDVIFDASGNLYGTTSEGGNTQQNAGYGVVWELMRSSGGWTEKVLYPFNGGADGAHPQAGVTLDSAGKLYGVTVRGGHDSPLCSLFEAPGCGVVFQLVPSGGSWTENVLYTFQARTDGGQPVGGLILDSQGNLYGSTALSFSSLNGGGTLFRLTPHGQGWSYESLPLLGGGLGPFARLVMDHQGRLYGTTLGAPGSVFELIPSGGGWTYRLLHQFTGGADGGNPYGLVLAPSGKLYGVASIGDLGACLPFGCGVVFEITP